jgi:hypothetical protein
LIRRALLVAVVFAGTAPGSRGYRGWSGSEKLEFTVDSEWATPP